jgi:signal transduction histidine kinase
VTAAGGGRRRGGRLFWRVYRHGLLLLLLVAVTVAAVGWALRGERTWHGRAGRAAAYAATRVAELSGDGRALAAELGRVRDAFGLEASVYDGAGALVASNVEPPVDPVADAPDEDGGPARLRDRRLGWAVPLAGGGVLAVAPPPHARDPMRGLALIGAVLAALALGSIPLARGIAAPVEAVTAAARRLGGGDLSARSHVSAPGEVGELARSFDEMAARLEALVRAEKELLANVSHELRTPLARIRVALELAAEGDPERARRHLEGIAGDLDELDRLVADVLAAARLEAGAADLRLARADVDAAALLDEVARRFQERHPGRTLERSVAPSPPALVGDAPLLRRMLANLLDNAAKYSEPPSPVSLAARGVGDDLVVEVRDRGIGIDAEDLPRLFTPFFRTDRSRARGTGGVGLGLVLARRIAEAHGGRISVASAPGEGTVVTVTLPGAPARTVGPPPNA